MSKYRPFEIHYHLLEYHPNINKCWGNSLSYLTNARNLKEAIKRLLKNNPSASIYNVTVYHPTVELEYNWTQKFLELENLIDK